VVKRGPSLRVECGVCGWAPWARDVVTKKNTTIRWCEPAAQWWCSFCIDRLGDPRQLELAL
jgi:hypothetical protein